MCLIRFRKRQGIKLKQQNHLGVPKIDFRISFDYGYLTIMKDMENKIDLVGPTINTCSKINSLCPINDMIIGGDLYEKTKDFEEYKIKKLIVIQLI